MDLNIEVSQVIFVRHGADSGDTATRLGEQAWLEHGEKRWWSSSSTYGSVIRRSVSFMIRLGSAMLVVCNGGSWRTLEVILLFDVLRSAGVGKETENSTAPR